MNIYDSGKATKTLLAEYVDGGPGCVRDDCDVRESFKKSLLNSDTSVLEERTKKMFIMWKNLDGEISKWC